jgi:hypothetical protein
MLGIDPPLTRMAISERWLWQIEANVSAINEVMAWAVKREG